MNALVTALILLSSCVIGQVTNVNSCDDDSIFPEVQVYSGLNNTLCIDQPCPIVPDGDITIDVLFTSPRYLENIKPKAVATFTGITLDYPLFQDDACDGIVNTVCPIVETEEVEYVHSFHLFNDLPEVTVNLRISIVDKDVDSDVICFIFDANVVLS